MEQQHPGAHVDEVPTAPPRIAPAATAITGFVGTFPAGPGRRPTTVQSAAEFMQIFGSDRRTTDTSIAVLDFFANGGSTAVIVATGGPDQPSLVDELVNGLSLLQPSPGEPPPVQLLCMPDMARRSTEPFSHAHYADLLTRITGFCVQHRILLIVDPNTSGDEIDDIDSWQQRNPSWGSSNSAVYFPRMHTAAGSATGGVPVAASGSVAGVIARTDSQRGVWKAPAGLEASIGGSVATVMSDRDQSPLNRHGINVIRQLDTAGTVIWGARTGVGPVGNDYRYIPVRRTALFLEHSLGAGLRWAVAEPNTESLWAQVASSVSNFMHDMWRHGALLGSTPADGFFVHCDETTMARVDLRRGRTIVRVGFAPLKPAEFVVLQIVLERRQH